MTAIIGYDPVRDLAWLKSKVPYIDTEDSTGFLVIDGGKPIGAVVLDNFLNSSAQATLVLDNMRAIKSGVIECAANFLFREMRREYAYAMIAANNKRSLNLCERIGFKYEMSIPDGYANNVSLFVMRLHRDDFSVTRKRERGNNG